MLWPAVRRNQREIDVSLLKSTQLALTSWGSMGD